MDSTDLTIVIPVFNESENILTAIKRIEDEVKFPHTIDIVYDFDEDTSIPHAKEAQKIYSTKINLIKNKYGRGALNAIKTGLENANGEYVVVTMADLSDPPYVINDMLNIAVSKNADIVCGSRYMPGGKQLGGPLLKGLMSKCAGLSLFHLAGVKTHDATNSFKLYKKSFLDKLTIESSGGFELGLELVVKAHLYGGKVYEVPTTWTDRAEGQSNFKLLQWLPHYLKWYFLAFRR